MSQCDCPRARRCHRAYPVDPPAERSCQLQAQVFRIGVVKRSAKLGGPFPLQASMKRLKIIFGADHLTALPNQDKRDNEDPPLSAIVLLTARACADEGIWGRSMNLMLSECVSWELRYRDT
ncbi:hypothetical protein AVEN_265320-1 [Araneus ventricosus]|uniref:Uncharacterized protein n=1 Tax=Araneus ventricosus TaxID=182803 RepID=A0A4Y2MME0_ARAVE|nr:hypothetical protein AVEN_265320-1 [Araneus ventricosus]